MESYVRNWRKICFWGLPLIILFSVTCKAVCFADMAKELRQKMTEIILLCEKININKSQAIEICSKLEEQDNELTQEINVERKRLRLVSYQEAMSSPRIVYNLKLIQKIKLYISKLKAKILDYQTGDDELKYLYQHLYDDLRIIESLNNIRVGKLMCQAGRLIDKYREEAEKLSIEIDDASCQNLKQYGMQLLKIRRNNFQIKIALLTRRLNTCQLSFQRRRESRNTLDAGSSPA